MSHYVNINGFNLKFFFFLFTMRAKKNAFYSKEKQLSSTTDFNCQFK
jgi:hypothetical protein